MMSKGKKSIVITIVTIVIGGALFFIIQRDLSSRLSESSLKTARVQMGDVLETVQTTGEVDAENEVLLLSPANSVVTNIVRLPGSTVKKGDTLLVLDRTPIIESIENLENQLEMKRNALEKNKLSATSSKIDLAHDLEIKKLRITSIKAELSDQEELLTVGGISQARIDKTQQELVLAEKEVNRTTQLHGIKLKQLAAEEEGIQLQINIQEKELAHKRAILAKMIIKAPSSGIVMEVAVKEGENVKENLLLVRMSEYTSFKILGEIEVKKADLLRVGGKVIALSGEEQLFGSIGNIRPEVVNDKISFDVYLEKPSHKSLRANQTVDLLVVTKARLNVMRVERADFFDNNRDYCYVVNGTVADFRKIKTGLVGLNYIEVLEGLRLSEEVIVSDVSRMKPKSQLTIVKK